MDTAPELIEELSSPADPAATPLRAHRWEADGPALVWTKCGEAHIHCGQQIDTLPAGRARWITGRSATKVHVPAGAVVVPIAIPDVDRAVVAGAEAVEPTLDVPPSAHAALLREYAYSLGFLCGRMPRASRILGATGRARRLPLSPPMPISPELRVVADEILAAPQNEAPPERLAALSRMSPSTLRRRFAEETGLPLGRWRVRARLCLAAELLPRVARVEAVAHRVGYATAGHLARAMRREWGITPGDLRATGAPVLEPRDEPELAAARSWRRTNGFHVALWVQRGPMRAQSGTASVPVPDGNVVWLPARTPVSVELGRDAQVLPIGWADGGHPVAGGPAPVIVDAAGVDDDILVGLSVRAHTSPDLDARQAACEGFMRLLGEDPRLCVTGGVDAAVEQVLAGLQTRPDDERPLADWARATHTDPAELAAAFRRRTGTTLPGWRALVRMHHARRWLSAGLAPSVVARRLGYQGISPFSRAFATAHGVCAREFQSVERATGVGQE